MLKKYSLVICLLFVVCAVAFHRSPIQAGKIVSKAITVPRMSPADIAVESSSLLTHFSQLIASESDFGGYTGPAGSLIFIGILILTLSPPLADPDQM